MSAFRGARLFASLGHHSMKCNRLHQRRIISLGLTSLCQVTMKKQALMDTNALPVNKYDLSSVGILSPTLSTLFSMEALALADGDSDVISEEDLELGIGRIPFSATQINTAQTITAIFININNFNADEYLNQSTSQLDQMNEANNLIYDKTQMDFKQHTCNHG